MDMIRLKNISYQYPGEVTVFEDLCFSLGRGQRVGIVGANGSGKTTLFHLIMGLIPVRAGDIFLFDTLRRLEKDFLDARRRMGYLFQDPDDQVFCPTVEEDIAFGPLNLGLRAEDARARADGLVEELGIGHLSKRITTKLSWGQKRLVSLAGVLAMDPEILILDEPTASIDDHVIARITGHLKKTDHALLVASHDRKFLEDLCDTIYLLKNGRLYPLPATTA